MAITLSNRNIYLGVHVTRDVKEALRHELKKEEEIERPSQSAIVHKLLTERLRELGYQIGEVI
jgi:hypothetical protein